MSGKRIVYAIAGSDCSGGAGIQADLLTLQALGAHACTLITALTAQNRRGVHRVQPTSPEQLRAEFAALLPGMPPAAIKLGMLATAALVDAVADLLACCDCPVICDPVLSASAGGELLTDAGRQALLKLLPRLTLLTPNAQEAAILTGLPVQDHAAMERAAERLLDLGAPAVLITGGDLAHDPRHRCDYFASREHRFWLEADSIVTPHAHGTGCTLASAIAAFIAQDYELRDAVVLGKMVVSAGLRGAQGIAEGTGAVAHPCWREVLDGGLANLPRLVPRRFEAFTPPRFAPCAALGLYPVVDDVAWVEKLLAEGVRTVQLRLKNREESDLRAQIARAVTLQRQYQAQLFINDYWRLALEYGAFGVHLGQEDLDGADLHAIAAAGLRLGTSNHAWYELARSHALAPSYLALGPIYATTTKAMRFAPQGLGQLREWTALLAPRYPLTAIGGIDQARAPEVLATGVGSIAAVRAITEALDYRHAVRALRSQLEGEAAA